MIAEKDPYIANAAKTLYRASEDDRIRYFCESREEGEKTLRTLQLALGQSNGKLQQKDEEIACPLAELNALRQHGRIIIFL